MKILVILIGLFPAFTTFTQMTLEVQTEPQPFDFVIPQLYPELKFPVKSMTWIAENDTLKKYVMDAAGNIVEEYDYDNNKQTFATTNTYAGKLKMQTLTRTNYDETVRTYLYTPAGKIKEMSPKRTVFNKKTVISDPDLKSIYEYDNNNNLVSNYRTDGSGVKTGITEYMYDDRNRLVKAVTNHQWESAFEYDANGNLLSRKESLNGSLSRTNIYEYDGENHPVSMQIGTTYSVKFTYKDNRMEKAVYTMNNGKQEVIDLSYNDGLLSEVRIQRTDNMSFSPFRLRRNYERSVPYDIRIEFVHDSHKNTTELKYYVDNVYKYSEKFVIEYY